MSADTVSPTRKRVRLSTLPPSESSSPAGLGIGQPDCSVYERPKPSLLDFDVRALQSSFPTPESSPDELETFCERSNVDSGTAPRLRRNLTSRAVARLRDVKPIPSSAVKPNDSSKDRLVAGLIGASVLAIESIWPSSACNRANDGDVLPLAYFVREVLRRSCTSCSTLQLALYYLHQSRHDIRARVTHVQALHNELHASDGLDNRSKTQSVRYPSPPLSPGAEQEVDTYMECDDVEGASRDDKMAELIAAQKSPILCGRRMFLAALMSASKYSQDRNYSNRAWSKISGLPIEEVNRNERVFLHLVQFSLHVGTEQFGRWIDRLSTLVSQGVQVEADARSRTSLGRSSSEPEVLPSSTTLPSHDISDALRPRATTRPRPVLRSNSAVECVSQYTEKIALVQRPGAPARAMTMPAAPPSYDAVMSASLAEQKPLPHAQSTPCKFGLEALRTRKTVISTSVLSSSSSFKASSSDWVVESGIVVE